MEQFAQAKESKFIPRRLAHKLNNDAVLNCIKIKAAAIENVDKLLRKVK